MYASPCISLIHRESVYQIGTQMTVLSSEKPEGHPSWVQTPFLETWNNICHDGSTLYKDNVFRNNLLIWEILQWINCLCNMVLHIKSNINDCIGVSLERNFRYSHEDLTQWHKRIQRELYKNVRVYLCCLAQCPRALHTNTSMRSEEYRTHITTM